MSMYSNIHKCITIIIRTSIFIHPESSSSYILPIQQKHFHHPPIRVFNMNPNTYRDMVGCFTLPQYCARDEQVYPKTENLVCGTVNFVDLVEPFCCFFRTLITVSFEFRAICPLNKMRRPSLGRKRGPQRFCSPRILGFLTSTA